MKTVQVKWRTALIVCIIVLVPFLLLKIWLPKPVSKTTIHMHEQRAMMDTLGSNEAQHLLTDDLVKAAKYLHEARKHVRGTKTALHLKSAARLLDMALKKLNVKTEEIYNRPIKMSTNICPEVYKSTTYGYPFFDKGFELTNCTNSTSLDKLVTLLINFDKEFIAKFSQTKKQFPLVVHRVLQGIASYNPNISILIGSSLVDDSVFPTSLVKQLPNLKLKLFNSNCKSGHVWKTLLKDVTTPFTLITRDITWLTADVRLDRLIREIERLNVSVAAGAIRSPNGHWKGGCHQRAFKNYTMVFVEGYDESIHECMFCDHVDGPFVIETNVAKKIQFDDRLEGEGVFEDLFLRMSTSAHETVVCPDSMFHVARNVDKLHSVNPKDWATFAHKWHLWKLKLSSGDIIQFECRNFLCFEGTGFVVHPCCLQELGDVVKFTMAACESAGVICEFQEGTLLGAVKMNKVLPWERDADLTFLTANYSKLQSLHGDYVSAGYRFNDGASLWCCADNRTAGGKFGIGTRHWHVELYGQHLMDSEMLMADGLPQTKLFFDGQWTGVPRNPGLHARNRYSHEIFAHAQHWLALGKSDGWLKYKTRTFTTCRSPNGQACLDQYNADGIVQFGDPIP
jgi:hypothetical protein